MVKITYGDALELNEFIQWYKVSLLKAKPGYSMRKLARLVRKSVADLIEPERKDILDAYCEKTEDGKMYKLPDVGTDKRKEFDEAFTKMTAKEIEIEINPFSPDDFDGISISELVSLIPCPEGVEKDLWTERCVNSFYDYFERMGIIKE
jgi:hypothetical protein